MKKNHLFGMMEELQNQNNRLRTEAVALRKDLNAYEQLMLKQIQRIGSPAPFYETPMQTLEALMTEIDRTVSKEEDNHQQLNQLRNKLGQSQIKNQELTSTVTALTKKLQKVQEQLHSVIKFRDASERQLTAKLQQVQKQQKQKQWKLQDKIRILQKRQVQLTEEQRVAVATVISSTKQQLVEYRQQVQKQFHQESVKLKQEIRSKDENFRKMLQGLKKIEDGAKLEGREMNNMREIVSKMENAENLNQTVSSLREELAVVKKQFRDTTNKKIALEAKVNDLKMEITSMINHFEQKDIQKEELNAKIQSLEVQLDQVKEAFKGLEHYYEQKWHNQFSNVKNSLEKALANKIKEHEKQLSAKKAEVSRKIQSYLFIHEEDTKFIGQLQKQIAELSLKLKQTEEDRSKVEIEKNELLIVLRENNGMIIQNDNSFRLQFQLRINEYSMKIGQLEVAMEQLTITNEDFQTRIATVNEQLKLQFQSEKQKILQQQAIEKLSLLTEKQKQVSDIKLQTQNRITQIKKQKMKMQSEFSMKLLQTQSQLAAEMQEKVKLLQIEKVKSKQVIEFASQKQKAIRKELSDVRSNLLLKVKELEKEIDHKKTAMEVGLQKSNKDEKIKLDLRKMLQEKIRDCQQLQHQKEDLLCDIQVKESQLNHVGHELEGLTNCRDQWASNIIMVREEFLQDMREVNVLHWRQVQLYKTKIWQLENILNRRPIREQDQRRIRNLSEQNRQLQEQMELQQAENIILQQVRHYYQTKQELVQHLSKTYLSQTEVRKPQSIVIKTKRPRRSRADYVTQPNQNEGEEDNQTAQDIKKMRRYILEKCKQNESERTIRHSSFHRRVITEASIKSVDK